MRLGALLCDGLHDYESAAAEFREAIRLEPGGAEFHYNFANALRGQGNHKEATAELREAIRLKPDHAEAHCNLGDLLRQGGKYAEALAFYRRGHELGSNNPGWPYPSAQSVRDCERLVALEDKLPALLKGQAEPADTADRIAIASICYDKGLHAAAAKLLREAFQVDAKLAEDVQAGNRYNAACSAALAGCGNSKDEPPPNQEVRERLRRQALDWLKADLAYWTKQVETGPPQAKALVSRKLQHWKIDPDLAGIRDPEALKRLHEGEQKVWRAFWSEVDSILDRA